MDALSLLLGGFILILSVYLHQKRRKFFEDEGIPFVEPTFLLGNMGPVVFNLRSIAEQTKLIYDSNPSAKYIRFHNLANPVIILRDLELIKSVKIKNFENFVNHSTSLDSTLNPLFANSMFFQQDDTWRNTRSVLSRAFSSSRMQTNFALISKCAMKFSDFIASESKNNGGAVELELKATFSRYTIDVVFQVFFGITLDLTCNQSNTFFEMAKEAVHLSYGNPMKMFIYRTCPWLSRFLKLRVINSKFSKYFSDTIIAAIATRESNTLVNNDMLQLMLQAKSDGNEQFQRIEDLTSHAFIFAFGGFDTTPTAISFVAYEIARNQRVQEKLHAEIDQVLRSSAGEVTYDVICSMKYLNAVVCESLRMYPPVSQADRMCNKTTELPPALPGLKPYIVRPGTAIWIPIYAIHRDPQYFPNPETFDPERFMNVDGDSNKEAVGYMPVGNGPRCCIAQRLTLMMIKVVIFDLLAKCKLEPSNKTPFVVLRNSLFIMEAKNGLWIRMIPRE